MKKLEELVEELTKDYYPAEFANEGDRQYWEELHNWQTIKAFIHQSYTAGIETALSVKPEKKTERSITWEYQDEVLGGYEHKQAFNSALQAYEDAIKSLLKEKE